MEDKKSSLTEAENAAAFSAATLRELQTRAQQALAAGREEAIRLEADITRQLDELAATVASQLAAESQSDSKSDSLQAEVERLTKELRNSRGECESLRSDLEGAFNDVRAKSAAHAETSKERDELLNRLADVESQLQSLQAEWQTKLENSQSEWHEERGRLSTERNQLAEKLADRESLELERDELIKKFSEFEAGTTSVQSEWRAKLENSQSEWQNERASLCAELAEKLADRDSLERERDELIKKVAELEAGKKSTQGELRTKLETSQSEWQKERASLCAERDQLAEKLTDRDSLERERDELIKKVAELESGKKSSQGEWRTKLEASQSEWQKERASLCAERDQLAEKLADRDSLERERDELVAKLAEHEAGQQSAQTDSRKKLESSKSEWQAERSKLRAERDELTRKFADHAALELERDELAQKLAGLETQQESAQAEWRTQLLGFEGRLREQQQSWNEQRTEWTTARTNIERERDGLQQKFDLALQDVQRLRSRVAELEQDLARRPEAKQVDSAELVGLRAERDALATRVEELEQQPASQIDPNVAQQLSDLRRRFEMAVEDVRELKTKNAALESKLATASKQPQSQPDAGGMDWESQKRRLIAALEGGGADDAPLPKKDRATIEGTIEMTDAVVAEKDREIAELQAQLAAASDGVSAASDQDTKIKELLDTDEVIAEHRKRIQELEAEMDQKLRACELEMSVERAKIGRQKVEIEEMKADLEAKLQDVASSGSAPTQGQPKRRWRSKLGLSGDE
jgi:chromosome segregation ATPase